jgi:hypothetical protein
MWSEDRRQVSFQMWKGLPIHRMRAQTVGNQSVGESSSGSVRLNARGNHFIAVSRKSLVMVNVIVVNERE